jgi:hypothetical protein
VGELLLPAAALACLVLIAGAVFGAFLMRRALLTRGMGSFICSMRRDPAMGNWALGVARYEQDRLDWFRLFAISLRPSRSLSRTRLVILGRHEPEDDAVASSVLPGWVVVRCAYGAVTLELAMSDPAYNGLAAWLESAPPGQHVYVT